MHYKNKSKAAKIVALFIGGFILFIFLAFILGFFIMILWNWLMPTIFSLPEINYWQACGLFILSKLLFANGKHQRNANNSNKTNQHSIKMKAKFKKWLDDNEACENETLKDNSDNKAIRE
jgi:hypothetical protein